MDKKISYYFLFIFDTFISNGEDRSSFKLFYIIIDIFYYIYIYYAFNFFRSQ